MSKNLDEKRKEPRFPINATVKMVGSSIEDVVYGVCFDVSRSGLKITTNTQLPYDDTLSLEINEKGITFNAEAEVAYCEEGSDGQFIVGLKANFEPPLPSS